MDAPYLREHDRIRRFLHRKEESWRKHASVVQKHDGPGGTPALIPFTTYDNLIVALQTRYDEMCARVDAQLAHGAPREYVKPLPRRSIANVIGRAVELPRGPETIYGQIAHATELIADDIECMEFTVIKDEIRLVDTFDILQEGLRDVSLVHRWAVMRFNERNWASKLTAAEDDLYYSSLDGIVVELGDVASLEWLREVATKCKRHAKHLDFDAETALENMRALNHIMDAARGREEANLIDFMRDLGVVHGFRLRRQSVITEYFKVGGENSDASGDSSDEGMDMDEETDEESSEESGSDEEMSDGED